VCCIYNKHKIEIKIWIFIIVFYMKQRKPVTLNRGHLYQNMTSISSIPYSHIVCIFWCKISTFDLELVKLQ
jgi:hypothetical protein